MLDAALKVLGDIDDHGTGRARHGQRLERRRPSRQACARRSSTGSASSPASPSARCAPRSRERASRRRSSSRWRSSARPRRWRGCGRCATRSDAGAVRLVDVWPLHGLRLRTADLELRPTTEADLPALCAILPPDDLEVDPSATRVCRASTTAPTTSPSSPSATGARMGTWSPHDWALPFAVRHDGELVGMQALEGPDWTAERTVDSWSWLAAAARGKGLGQADARRRARARLRRRSGRAPRSARPSPTTRRRSASRARSATATPTAPCSSTRASRCSTSASSARTGTPRASPTTSSSLGVDRARWPLFGLEGDA